MITIIDRESSGDGQLRHSTRAFQHKGCAGFVNGDIPKDGAKELSCRTLLR